VVPYTYKIFDANTFKLLQTYNYNETEYAGCVFGFLGWDNTGSYLFGYSSRSASTIECEHHDTFRIRPEDDQLEKAKPKQVVGSTETRLPDCWNADTGRICYKVIYATRYEALDTPHAVVSGLKFTLNGNTKTLGWTKWSHVIGFNGRGDLIDQGDGGEGKAFTAYKMESIEKLF
jgi:hypothetical protein